MVLSNLYKENILDHFKNPRNYGRLSKHTHSAQLSNSSCGDELTIDLEIKDGIIQNIGFEGRGCAISLASMSILSEMLKGKPLSEVKTFSKETLLDEIGMEVTSPRIKCALLSLETFRKSVE